MMYLINLLEGLIAAWTISELCYINKKNSFIFITTIISFIASYICDLLQYNSWPLLIAYLFVWFIMASIYTKRSYLYNFFVSLICNYIINISVIFPLLYVYDKNVLLASIMVRIIQFVVGYLLILYRKRYQYIDNKYWIPVMIILVCCMIVLEDQIYSYFSATMKMSSLIVIFMTFIIAGMSLIFFYVIEKIVHEKSLVFKQLEREQYRNLSYDIIEYAKRELDYLHHGLIYRLMLIKGKVDSNAYDDARKIIDSYIDDINKYSQIVTTGNEVFDLFFTINTSNVNFDIVKNINIKKREFYNSLDFINLLSGLLNLILDHTVVHFSLEDKGELCVISLSSVESFFVKENAEIYMKNIKNIHFIYDISIENELYLIKIIVSISDENYL